MDEEEVLEGEEEEQKGGGKKKLIIMLVLFIVVLVGAAVALRFFAPGLIPGWGEKQTDTDPTENPDDPKVEPPEELGVLYPITPFIVNLVDPSGKRYLKLTLSLELENAELKVEVDNRLPQIQDGILVLLSTKSFTDISTLEGKRRLRMEIINRCNAILKTGKIKNVFFSEFVIQ